MRFDNQLVYIIFYFLTLKTVNLLNRILTLIHHNGVSFKTDIDVIFKGIDFVIQILFPNIRTIVKTIINLVIK